MNFYLIQSFVKKQKDERKNKTKEQLRRDNVSRVEISKPYIGWKKTMYSTISKWIWG
jgi:hypothetical protein